MIAITDVNYIRHRVIQFSTYIPHELVGYIGLGNVWLTAEELSSSLFEVGCRWVRRDDFLRLLSCVSFY